MDWRARHRLECKSFGVVSLPSIHVPSANTNDLKNTLVHLSKTFITGGEEREWNPAAYEMAKDIGRRLFALGGRSHCISVCDWFRGILRGIVSADAKRCTDAKLLEVLWSDPVIPGWWP
jgi:hypothetical protein